MISRKISKKLLNDLKKKVDEFPPYLMAALIATLALPVNVASAEEIDEDNPTLVSPSEENEGNLDYLVLTDYFITAERIPMHRLDTPATVYLITAEEIEANHYQDLGEALSTVPGVFYVAHENRVTINGNNRILILQNGQRIDNDATISQSVSANLRVIPSMKMIERIEVVKGGGSALYGSDAVGGVINIVTKKGKEHETTIDVNYGSWHRQNYEITNQGTMDKLSWFVTGGFSKSHNADYNGASKNNIKPNGDMDMDYIRSDYDDGTVSARLDNQFDDRSSLTALFTHTTHNYADRLDYIGYSSVWPFDSKDKYTNVQLSYNFKEGTSTPGYFRYFNNSKISTLEFANDFYGRTATRVQGFDYQNGWELGQHKLIAGVEWHKTKAVSKAGKPDGIAYYGEGYDEKETTTSYYLQDTMTLGDKWTLIPGIRLDHSDKYKNNWSPKVALNYRADDKTKVYASWGRFYRRPTFFDRFYFREGVVILEQHSSGSWDFYPDSSLEPEKGHTETIGFEHNFDDNTRLGLSLFNTKVTNATYWYYFDLSDYYWWGGNNFATPYDDGNEKQRGFELSFNSQLSDKWNIGLGYMYIKSDRDFVTTRTQEWEGVDRTADTGSDITFYTPKNSFNVGVNYKCGPWKANLIGKFASSFGTPGLSSYAVLDFNASCDVADWATIYFKANNLTNKDYSYHKGHHTPGRFVGVGAQFKF